MRNKTRNFRWMRHMRTTAEIRANQDCPYARAKRNGNNLANSWDDDASCYQKTWKVQREKQYHTNGRGQRHEYTVSIDDASWTWSDWNFKEYCEEHSIPFDIIKEYESHWFVYTTYTRRVRTKQVLKYHSAWDGKTFIKDYSHPLGYSWDYKWVTLEEPIVTKRLGKRLVAHHLVWWSDKDIGIEYIVQKRGYY